PQHRPAAADPRGAHRGDPRGRGLHPSGDRRTARARRHLSSSRPPGLPASRRPDAAVHGADVVLRCDPAAFRRPPSLLTFSCSGFPGREGGFRGYGAMMGKAIQDLVGRVMIDREFLGEIVRNPEIVLADYELTTEERAVIMLALGR